MKSMIRENKNFYEIELFLNTYFENDSEKLFKFYFKYLDKVNDFLSDDLSKNLFELKQKNKDLYDHLHSHKLFTTK